MSLDLITFVNQIEKFDDIPASQKIDYFVYYHTSILGNEGCSAKDIEIYFNELKISKYSNIPQYLKNNSKKVEGKTVKFILQNGLYHLERTKKNEIDGLMNVPKIIAPTSSYF